MYELNEHDKVKRFLRFGVEKGTQAALWKLVEDVSADRAGPANPSAG